MDSCTFDNLFISLNTNDFIDNKVDTIKTTIEAVGYISASQVAQLLQLISFEDAKLEVAKMAYEYAVDKFFYSSIVGEALSYSDSKEKLNEYIQQY